MNSPEHSLMSELHNVFLFVIICRDWRSLELLTVILRGQILLIQSSLKILWCSSFMLRR